MPLKMMRDDLPTINLAPMVDIVLLLMIFFMVGSQYADVSNPERDIAVRVPQVSSTPTSAATPRRQVINVLGNGIVQLDSQPVSLAQLEQILRAAKAQNPSAGVVVRGDSNSVYQTVADVIAVCRRAEIQDVNLAVRVAQAER